MNKEVIEAVEGVIKAWVEAGPNPNFHARSKDMLRRNWPTLYNAVKTLAHAKVYSGDQNTGPIGVARCPCSVEWAVADGDEVKCPECGGVYPYVVVRMLRRVGK